MNTIRQEKKGKVKMGKTYRRNPNQLDEELKSGKSFEKKHRDSKAIKSAMSSEVKNNTNRVLRTDTKKMKQAVMKGEENVLNNIVAKKGTNNGFAYS